MPKGQKVKFTKEELELKYVTEGKNARQVASEFGVTKTCILRHMSLYGIKRRPSPTDISRSYGSIGYKNIPANYMTRIRNHALELKVEYNITSKELYELFVEQNGCCAISGLILHFYTKENKILQTASLDRMDGTKGYIKGNIQWIHKDLQKMKQNKSNEEFIRWSHIISDFNRSDNGYTQEQS